MNFIMSSYVDMSLEEIIQKKRNQQKRPKDKRKKTGVQSNIPNKKTPVIDARYKLILKQRQQPIDHVVDARERLLQIGVKRDARTKIEQLKKMKQLQHQWEPQNRQVFQNRAQIVRTVQNKQKVFTDTSRHVSQRIKTTSRRDLGNNILERRLKEKKTTDRYTLKPIIRTVHNDNIQVIDDDDDPMGEEQYVHSKPNMSKRMASLQLKIIAQNNETRDRSTGLQRTIVRERERSPLRPQSILKKRPMAALRSENKDERIEKPALEYRIIVSNLRNTVTGADIQELFGDVGGMLESRLVRPGTAEVIYKSQEDAQKAVDLYHNRQLDGQPMTCLLVIPRSNAATVTSRNGSKTPLYSTNSNVEPDLSTFHKVLFSNF